MNLRETYNRIAEDWHKDHQKDDWWLEGTDTFIALLPKGAKVLDVGCGSGSKSKYLKEKGLVVTGVDFSDKLLEIARREVPEVEFRQMDMQEVGNIEERFDGVFVQASLLHIPKKEVPVVLEGFVKVLKPNGYLYVAVKEVKAERPEEEEKTEDDYGYAYTRFFSYFSMEELKKYFLDLGLSVEYEIKTPSGKTFWLQIIGQKRVD